MARITLRDRFPLGQRQKTDQGYLLAPAIIGRCGIQVYTRGELGLDGDPRAMVRLMRTPEEVFRPETIASFENKPITDEHPGDGVDASTWKSLALGGLRDVGKQPGDLLGAKTLVMDKHGVEVVEGGKDYLSCGYSFELDLTPGTAPDGQAFDGYQRNILGDHVAIVSSPRGGPVCRIGDKEETMATKRIIVDGLPLDLDEVPAAAVERVVKDRDRVIEDFDKAVDEAKKTKAADATKIAEQAKTIAARDAEIVDLKAKLATAQALDIDKLVADRATVAEDARKLAPELAIKGTAHDIRKAAVAVACGDSTSKVIADAIFGEGGIEKATEQQVKAVFDALLKLPRQAALDAQSRAVGVALGINNGLGGVTGPIETIDGIPDSQKQRAA